MGDPRPIVLAAVLAAWFLLSVANQVRGGRWVRPVRRHVPFGLIPVWTFFAPNPARSDLRLVWRDERDGSWGGWQEVVLPRAPAVRRALVNPEAVPPKALADLVRSIASPAGPDDRLWVLSGPYLVLLTVVVDRPRPPGATAVQFAVVRTRWDGDRRHVEVTFLSDEHGLRPVDAV